jgi:RimJ/RimL family protein N-acetyltransferase
MRFPDDVPTLTDGEVTLRPHRIEDAPGVVEQCIDPDSVRWTTVPLGYTSDDAKRFLTDAVPGGWERESEFAFAIETAHPDGQRRFSGTVSLRDEGPRRAEIAFGAHPAVRGRGVMTTAVQLLLDWGFKYRDLETVSWLANVGNAASRRVAWKAGFTFAGTVRRWLNHRGEYLDGWIATLHRENSRDPKTCWRERPVLVGRSVILRPFDERDAPRIVEGATDPRTRHFIPFLSHPFTEVDALDYIHRNVEHASLGVGATWAIADPECDLLLGVCGFPRMGLGQGEIGYWAHPDARGRGVTSEAVRLVARHGLIDESDGGFGLRRVFLKTASTNAASIRVALRNGFSEVGRERAGEELLDGTVDDLLVFDLLPRELDSRAIGAHAEGATTPDGAP